MKTNQVMVRQMGDFNVLQRTKDGMFCATGLLKQWNLSSGQNKEIKKFFENESTKEFITSLISEENLHGQKSAYVKSRASRGDNAGTWMHSLLFIDFAMWINPSFKVKVLRFVYDQLIEYRNEAGDAYKEMSAAIAKIVDKDSMSTAMKDIAKYINYVVYNDHQTGMRNKQANESKLKELFELERDIAKLINFGFIKSKEQIISHLKIRYKDKYKLIA